MRTLNTFPPNWEQIQKVFPRAKEQEAVFCYGEVLHNPFGAKITRDLEVHEATHSNQQGKDPKGWWDKYCEDPKFRYEQELQAYGLQLYFLKTNKVKKLDEGKEIEMYIPTRVIDWYLDKIAQTLSGELYGNVTTYHKARTAIRHFIKEI